MAHSDVKLRAIALAAAVALVVVVHGEKRATVTYEVPVSQLSGPRTARDRLPATVSVAVSGPWARLRRLDAEELGPAEVLVSPSVGGTASWYVVSEKLRVPHGLRVETIHPAQGTLELGAAGSGSRSSADTGRLSRASATPEGEP